jgi:hypothetical protein
LHRDQNGGKAVTFQRRCDVPIAVIFTHSYAGYASYCLKNGLSELKLVG